MFALPESMTFVQGAPVDPTAVAVHAVSSAPLRPGDRVLVTSGGTHRPARGPSGGRLRGGGGGAVRAEPDPQGTRCGLGLTRVVDPGGDDMAAAVVDLTGGRGFDVCRPWVRCLY